MEDNEIMETEEVEVTEVADEKAVCGFKQGLMVGAGTAVATIALQLLCDYVIKPNLNKLIARKAEKRKLKEAMRNETKAEPIEVEGEVVETQE